MVCNGMRRQGSPQELERVRREAVALAAQGVTRPQIAAALDRSVHTVNKWLALARQHGFTHVAVELTADPAEVRAPLLRD